MHTSAWELNEYLDSMYSEDVNCTDCNRLFCDNEVNENDVCEDCLND